MDIIKSSDEITSLFEHGRRINSSSISFIVSTQHDRTSSMVGRAAFIAGKKNGNAVWRNAAKRRMREVCRQCGGVPDGMDVVFIARRNILGKPYESVLQDTRRILSQLKDNNES